MLKRLLSLAMSAAMVLTLLPAQILPAAAEPALTPAAGDVLVNEQNFPDVNFRAYIKSLPEGKDEILTQEELAGIKDIDCTKRGIADLTGIEHFTGLRFLTCRGNNLQELDLSSNTGLSTLYCENNRLTKLDVGVNTVLNSLDCSGNRLTNLDLSKNTSLASLYCFNNQLTELNVAANINLKNLNCSDNRLSNLDLTQNSKLTELDCSDNQLSGSMNLSQNGKLTKLNCSYNQLTKLDLSFHTLLTTLDCSHNQLISLKLRQENRLTKLDCSCNQLTSCPVPAGKPLADVVMGQWQADGDGHWKMTADGTGIQKTAHEWGRWTPETGNTELDTRSCPICHYSEHRPSIVIDVDEKNFPDPNFRAFVQGLPEAMDNKLTSGELEGLSALRCENRNIKTLTGIEYFTALGVLDCSDNQLSSLDLSHNTELYSIDVSYNQLTRCPVPADSPLAAKVMEQWQVDGNAHWKMTADGTEIQKDAHKWTPWGPENNSAEVDIRACSDCQYLERRRVDMIDINEQNFPDPNFRAVLEELPEAADNKLSSRELKSLHSLECKGKNIKDLTGIEYFTELESLYCSGNQLGSLDLSHNTALSDLDCSGNQLGSLDLSHNTALSNLYCSGNQLSSLDLSHNTALNYLDCSDNRLSSLDLSHNTALNHLDCSGNRLTRCPVPTDSPLAANVMQQWQADGDGHWKVTADGTGIQKIAHKWTSWSPENGSTELDVRSCNVCHYSEHRRVDMIDINEQNFPDPNFRAFVKGLPGVVDNKLSSRELESLPTLECKGKNIKDLTGIGYFTALESLDCSGNRLNSLDLSHNTALTSLKCGNNQLTTLNLSHDIPLKSLYCQDNQLTDLDLGQATALRNLDVSHNRLTRCPVPADHNLASGVMQYQLQSDENQHWRLTADGTNITRENHHWTSWNMVPENEQLEQRSCIYCDRIEYRQAASAAVTEENFPDAAFLAYVKSLPGAEDEMLTGKELKAVTTIDCSGRGISTLTGIEYFTELTELNCSDNQLTELDVSAYSSLENLNCSGNRLAALNVSQNDILQTLDCSGNQLTALDISNNHCLTTLNCANNQLTTSQFQSNTLLIDLNCANNQFTTLDANRESSLTTLNCANNQLTELKVLGCSGLTTLNCANNQLTELNVRYNDKLTTLNCAHNRLPRITLPGSLPADQVLPQWQSDDAQHWHMPASGSEKADLGDHSWEAWTETKPAGAGVEGIQERECSVCHRKQTQTIPALPEGFAISGTITSAGTGTVTVQLFEQGADAPAYTVTTVDGAYTIDAVQPGTYTMKVSKLNHVTRSYEITVTDSALTQNVTICLLGDVNSDGVLDLRDWTRLYDHVSDYDYLAGYALTCADVNGDAIVDLRDWTRMYDHVSDYDPLW